MFKKFLRALNQHLEEYLIALFLIACDMYFSTPYLGRKNLAATVSFILPF